VHHRVRTLISILSCVVILSGILVGLSWRQPAAAEVPEGNTIIYNLYATDGFVTLADGTQAYIYGFIGGRQGQTVSYLNQNGALLQAVPPDPTGGPIAADEQPLAGNAQFPAPVIYAAVGDVVEIRLKNLGVTQRSAPNDPHTIHLHGLDVDAANDGVPETSVAAVPANAKMIGAGNVVVYMFSPTLPGTYMYHCHQEASIHVQMGMYGALVVYNPDDPAYLNGGPGKGYGGNLWGHEYTKDYILLLSEFDLGQHVAENRGAGFYNPVNFKPTYWFINGLSFPNTIHAGVGFVWSNWIAAHPNYDPFIVGSVGAPDKVLLRVINLGFQAQPMHMHGFHAKIIGSDQRAWDWANAPGTPSGVGMEKNTLLIGSGETYEWLIDFGEQTLNSTYDTVTLADGTQAQATQLTGTQTRYNAAGPSSNATVADPAIPDAFTPPFTYVGGPIVGPEEVPVNDDPELRHVSAIIKGETNQWIGQYFPFHNHDDYKATNNGVYPGGMFTMIATTP
jgi:FtsP/CotA-like multicopper oxidase with cupredoxin domain